MYIESQGVAEPIREVIVRPRISGFITESSLEDGKRVEAGETMLMFSKEEWRYLLQQAEYEYESALSAYTIESRQRQRQEGTDNQGDEDRMVRISRSEEHTSELQSRGQLVCRLLLDNKKNRE